MDKRPVLIVSPIPSHPQQQGNSARIYQMGRMFQRLGHPVHFVYFGLEGLTDADYRANLDCWDRFHYVQPNGPAPAPSLGEFYHVDDWYDDRISSLVERLCVQWDYEACLVNYVWCSKVLEAVPNNVFKAIDTHDVFGDRHLVARAAGLEPVWFYTSKALEAMALQRADLVISIQNEEEKYFRELSSTPVATIGYVIPRHPLGKRRRAATGKIRVGYLGSGNPFNLTSIQQFHQAIEQRPALMEKYEFHLAGSICNAMQPSNRIFQLWGLVGEVQDFYSDMDVLVNPMVGGTGLKIKSVEALSFGLPLLATADAMVGIASSTGMHISDSPAAIADELGKFSGKNDKPDFALFDAYIGEQVQAFKANFDKRAM